MTDSVRYYSLSHHQALQLMISRGSISLPRVKEETKEKLICKIHKYTNLDLETQPKDEIAG